MSAPMPSKYVAGPFIQYSAQPGGDLLPESRTSAMARPNIPVSGGRRRTVRRKSKYSKRKITRRHKHKSRKQKGGFVPSVGEAFAAAAAKYITPIALYGLYRFINNKKTRKASKGTRRH